MLWVSPANRSYSYKKRWWTNTTSAEESIWSASTQTHSAPLKKKARINGIASLKGAALWSSVKRRSSAALTVCNLKDTLNYRQQKLGRHAASIITAPHAIHRRVNGLASRLPRNFKNACTKLVKSARVYSVTFFPPVVLVHMLSVRERG